MTSTNKPAEKKPAVKKDKLSALHFDDKNFNLGSEIGNKYMDQSFSKFGAGRSILVDKNNNIIAGNKSAEKYGEQGGEDIIIVETTGDQMVVVKRTDVDLNTPQGREMALADNATAKANIVWAEDIIAAEMGAATAATWGVEITEQNLAGTEDEYEIPEEVPTDIQEGDLITIGNHRLLCGDSTRATQWEILMDGEQADMFMTDPPYNVNYGNEDQKILNDHQADESFYNFLFDFFTAAREHTKQGGAWYVWHADSEGYNFRAAYRNSGLLLKQCLIWVKNALVMGRQDYQWKHEPCLYGWNPGSAHYFTKERNHTTVIEDQIDLAKLSKKQLMAIILEANAENTKGSVVYADKPSRNDLHPTMKPITLLAPLIQNSSNQGEIVADGFVGSGSTMVASHQLRRRCYAIELAPKYCQVTINRMLELDPSLQVTINGELYEPKQQKLP